MAYLYNYQPEDFPTLLAAQEIDATKGALFASAAKLEPNKTHRTILIGLGGTGIKTLDYVKGVISTRLTPDWTRYIGFLGIDADYTEFDHARFLETGESVITTKPGADARKQTPASYPAAWRPFSNPEVVAGIQGMNSPGSGQKRLIGRLKIHDKDATRGSDEEIVNKLASLKNAVLSSVAAPGNYEVYVIGSVSGGTCSGGFLEMPALIRKAFNCNNLRIYAMLYLPDTLTSLDPNNAASLMANGYASLKELNYYQGLSMRRGYTERWGYNDPAAPELEIDSTKMFYDIPYLIGTPDGAAAGSDVRARQNIAEFMISILTKVTVTNGAPFLTDAFLSNVMPRRPQRNLMPGVAEAEAAGTAHEFPRHYGAIGFAQIAAPKKIVRSYIVGQACLKAGLQPVSAEKRAELQANGAPLLPFRGEDDLLNATVGTQKAKEILKPLTDIFGSIYNVQYSFMNASGWGGDQLWQRLHRREQDDQFNRARLEQAFEEATSTQAMQALDAQIRKAFTDFRANVQAYVAAEGPLAFYTLYTGRFGEVNGDFGTGIGAMLQNLKAGKTVTGVPYRWDTPATTATALATALSELDRADGLLDRISKRASTAAAWVTAYDNWMKARIIEKRREYVLAENGKLNEQFVKPAALLADQLRAFGYVLSTLTDIYSKHGQCMNDYGEFSKAHDNTAEINLAAVSPYSHQWLQRQAQAQLANVNAVNLRTALINDFFAGENSVSWLTVPDDAVISRDGRPMLAKDGVAVPAREYFDRIMQNEVPTVALSIKDTFAAIHAQGTSYGDFANDVIQQLALASGIMLNANNIPSGAYNLYLMYPDTLNSSTEGTEIAQAITSAAQIRFEGIQVYSSDDTDSIKMYQMAAPFEIYHLNELKIWEDNYWAVYDSLLHGMSPDVEKHAEAGRVTRYEEKTPWKDYPSLLLYDRDPKIPDPETGIVSHEGEIRKKLAVMIQRARELGVLYSKKDNNGWRIYRLHCDRSVNWTLDISLMEPDALGLLPTGRALAEAVASQNGKTVADLSLPVELAEQGANGVFGTAHVSEEFAWKWVERTLRAHMPMQIQVRNTVKQFEQWYTVIEEYNTGVLNRLKPAKLVFILRAQILKNTDGIWKVTLANGTERPVARLDESGINMMNMTNPQAARLVKAGFRAYHLFVSLAKQADIDDCYRRAREKLDDMAAHEEYDRIMEGVQMAEFVQTETAQLVEMGAILAEAETGEPRTKLVDSMRTKGITDIAIIKDIQQFYHRASLWEML